jgi:hypothetical protein
VGASFHITPDFAVKINDLSLYDLKELKARLKFREPIEKNRRGKFSLTLNSKISILRVIRFLNIYPLDTSKFHDFKTFEMRFEENENSEGV